MLLLKTHSRGKKFAKGVCELKSMTNWAAICVFSAVALLLYHDPFLLLWWPPKPAEKSTALPLDMATDSIDDMYDGCRSETASAIDLFGVFEWHYNTHFSYAWALAEGRAKKPMHSQLKEEHAVVLYMYTRIKYIQQYFDHSVKTGKHVYSTYRFKFHYFYFYLTEAIQLLRHSQASECSTAYLRTQKHFDQNVLNTNMRFGAFTWAALSKQSFDFNGNVSCFEIYSCFGADITYYSALTQRGQVLIPPYEVFKISHVLTNEPWCSVVYKLHSTNTPRRDLNCKLHQRQIKTYFGAAITYWQESSVGMMTVYILLLILISLFLVERGQKGFVAGVLGALLVLIIILVTLRVSQ